VATTAPNVLYKVDVLLGNGNGTFGSTTAFSTTYGPFWIVVADLNGDGKPDLAIAHCCGETDTTFKFATATAPSSRTCTWRPAFLPRRYRWRT